jgi:chromosome segregation ATPase
LEKKVADLKRRKDEYKAKSIQCQTELDGKKSECKQKISELEQLMADKIQALEAKNIDTSRIRDENAALLEAATRYKEKFGKLRDQATRSIQDVVDRDNKIQQLESREQDLVKKVASLNSETTDLRNQLVQSKIQHSKLDHQYANAVDSVKQLAVKIKDKETIIESLKAEIVRLESELEKNKDSINRMTALIREKDVLLAASKQELQDLAQQLSASAVSLQNVESKLAIAESRVVDLQKESENVKSEYKTATIKITDLQSKIEDLQSKKRGRWSDEEIDEHQEQMRALITTKNAAIEKRKDVEQRLVVSDRMLKSAQERVLTLEQLEQDLKIQIDTVKEQAADAIKQASLRREVIVESKYDRRDNQQELRASRERASELEKQLESAQSRLEKSVSAEDAESAIREAQAKIDERIRQYVDEIESLRNKQTESHRQILQLTARIEELNATVADKNAEIAALNTTLADTRGGFSEARQRWGDAQDELDRVKADLIIARRELENKGDSAKERRRADNLLNQVHVLNQRANAAESKLETLEAKASKIPKYEREIAELEEKLASLTRDASDGRQERVLRAQIEARLEQAQEKLQGCNDAQIRISQIQDEADQLRSEIKSLNTKIQESNVLHAAQVADLETRLSNALEMEVGRAWGATRD